MAEIFMNLFIKELGSQYVDEELNKSLSILSLDNEAFLDIFQKCTNLARSYIKK